MLKIYNTLSHKIEDFKPLSPPDVGYYSCGPTVYDYAHIGHARTFVFADILQRVLEFNGFRVKRVMNITDVGHLTSDADSGEDKMEKGAKRENKTVWEIAEFYSKDFFEMLSKLNIKKPEIITKATDHISSMVQIIELLEKRGYTYKLPDGIYFDTSKLRDYGKLTGQNFEQLQKTLKVGIRVEMVEGKKNPTDFALWKFSPSAGSGLPKRQMEWESPWGRGFPGWHIECSAMSMDKLGETLDIHTGGVDHIPIHHTNEIAQSEAATGKKFVNYWVHGEHLLVDGKKMSKSLGNFYRVEDIEKKGIDPLALRYLFLTASYRIQMNFTWEALEGAQRAYEIIKYQVSSIKYKKDSQRTVLSAEKLGKVNELRDKFTEAVSNDLNIPVALSVVWETLKSNIPSSDKFDLIILFDEVLGLELAKSKIKNQKSKIPEEILELVKKREKLRKEKMFAEADEVRREVEKKGYFLEDTDSGSLVRKM